MLGMPKVLEKMFQHAPVSFGWFMRGTAESVDTECDIGSCAVGYVLQFAQNLLVVYVVESLSVASRP